MSRRKPNPPPQQQPKLIHLGTRIETVFAVQDEDGNVINTIPVRAEMGLFKPFEFASAFNLIAGERQKIVEQLAKQ
ncbi:MAG TPA: hypothetical protein VLR90_08590 [Blastocatellia bacterium]|nr:hypothetical protein [Blastocatellia bacterium]